MKSWKHLFTLLCLFCFGTARADEPAASAATSVKEISAKDVKALLDRTAAEKDLANKPLVLDIRTPEEYKAGHIEGSTNLDFNSPAFAADAARLDKSRPYVLHCASGGRSSRSLETFKKLGFKSISHLKGGFQEWRREGLPSVSGP